MTANIEKTQGYGVLTQSIGGASVTRASGYVVQNIGGSFDDASAGIPKAQGYQLYSNPSTIIKAQGYQFLWPGVWSPIFKASGYILYYPLFPPTFNFNVDYDFVEERFPDCISFGSDGGPGFKTNVVEFDSGIVSVNEEWDSLRARYTATFETATPDEIRQVEDFFYICKGRAIGFRFKDWKDYQIIDQNIAVGDGVTTTFQLFKRYQSGNTIYDRPIKKPLEVSSNGDDMQITVDGVLQTMNGDVYVNESLGTISFDIAPPPGAIVKVVYGEFDVPVRFDTDTLDISFDEFRQLSLEVPLIEIQT
jgi:uncharacterized protein (TIGR02217 family)